MIIIISYTYNEEGDFMDFIYLDSIRPRECVQIKGIMGCGKAKKRLYELGLYKNSMVKVMKNDFGPLILNLSGNKLALGRNLAARVVVEPCILSSKH